MNNSPPFDPHRQKGIVFGKPPEGMSLDEAMQQTMLFGKYKGRPLGEIATNDPSYLGWFSSTVDGIRSARFKEAIGLVAEAFAAEIQAAAKDKDARR